LQVRLDFLLQLRLLPGSSPQRQSHGPPPYS
jgi:hypothetical protein